MSFQGQDVTIRGSQDAGSGWIRCLGQQWWQIESKCRLLLSTRRVTFLSSRFLLLRFALRAWDVMFKHTSSALIDIIPLARSTGANYTDNSLSANRPQTIAFDVKRGSLLDLKIHKRSFTSF